MAELEQIVIVLRYTI